MGSKSVTNVVTQNSIALNAYIYGYVPCPASHHSPLTRPAMPATRWSLPTPLSSSCGGPRSVLMPK